MKQDIRYALRALRRSPGFSVVAVLALATGIGANTAIFSVVNAVLLRSLPYRDPARIVMIWSDNPKIKVGFRELPSSPGDYADFRKQTDEFQAVTTYSSARFNLAVGAEPYRVGGAAVSYDFFETFGRRPMLGRPFTNDDQQPNANRVAVLSHDLWTRRFGADPAIIGKKIPIDDVDHEVVGVMPPGFTWPRGSELPAPYGYAPDTEIWVPRAFTPKQLTSRSSRNHPITARLAEGVSLARANSVLHGIASRVQRENPMWRDWGFRAVSLRDGIVGRVETLILFVSLAVALVLLIACANVANLFLARATGRTREIAVRIALGASRRDIIRQILSESVILSTAGAVLGVALAQVCIRSLIASAPPDIPRLAETSIDAPVLLFTLGLSFLTAILFGFAPALQLSRTDVNGWLREGVRGTEGRGRQRVRNLLTSAEVALALILLVSAGLLIRSFVRLYSVDPGFNTKSVLAFDAVLPELRYASGEKRSQFHDRLTKRLAAMPGTDAAGAISSVPLSGSASYQFFTAEGLPDPGRGQSPLGEERHVSMDYFRAMGTPLVAGRGFTEDDRRGSKLVLIVNETLARKYFPAGAVGKRIRTSSYEDTSEPWREIIGVVRDVKQAALQADPVPQFYIPVSQSGNTEMSYVIRTSLSGPAAIEQIRAAVRDIDPKQPIGKIMTMEHVVEESVSRQRFTTTLLALFAGTAMLLAIIGLYGVMAYNVTQRTREIGVRMALGAAYSDVLTGVLRQGLTWVAIGAAAGLLGSLALGRVMESFLYGISPSDPLTYLAVIGTLFAVAIVAVLLPARRAARVDPVIALRFE